MAIVFSIQFEVSKFMGGNDSVNIFEINILRRRKTNPLLALAFLNYSI